MTSILMFSILRGIALLSIGQSGGATPQSGPTAVPPAVAAPTSAPAAVPVSPPTGVVSTVPGALQSVNAINDAVRVNSIWDFVVKGGPVMFPIGLCSMVALTVIVERSLSLRRRRVIPPGFTTGLQAIMRSGGDVNDVALRYCRDQGGAVAEIFSAAIRKWREPLEILERHVQEAGERAVFHLQRGLRVLSVIASLSTMLGLLGTIFGMINAFQTVATSQQALGKTELLAKGIYEAMITTAAGLLVAIPTIAAHQALSARVDHLVHALDQMIMDFVEAQRGPRAVVAAPELSRSTVHVVGASNGDGRIESAGSLMVSAPADVRAA